jgi:hypothetical protein
MELLKPLKLKLIRSLNVEAILPYLRANDAMTKTDEEICLHMVTSMAKASKLIDILTMKSGVTTSSSEKMLRKFVEALYQSHQVELYDLIINKDVAGHVNSVRPTENMSPPVEGLFSQFKNIVDNLKPIQLFDSSDRAIENWKTSFTAFSISQPRSSFCIKELPYLIAYIGGTYAEDTVLTWPGAPSKSEFQRNLRVYKLEIADILDAIRNLDCGAVHFVINTNDECKIKKLLQACGVQQHNTNDAIELILNPIQLGSISENYQKIIAAIIHLISVVRDFSFIIRKTQVPRPNSYLYYNASEMTDSPVIFTANRAMFKNIIERDESVTSINLPTISQTCPWL